MVSKLLARALVREAREGTTPLTLYSCFSPSPFVFLHFRYNARGFDLNRNFPDYFKQNNKRSQPETEAVKEWISKIQFVLSGNIHGGALVASYPFDNTPNSIFSSVLSTPSLTPDDDVFKHLAGSYSFNHGRMFTGEPCKVIREIFDCCFHIVSMMFFQISKMPHYT